MYITEVKLNKIIKKLAKKENVPEEFIRLEMEKAINLGNWNNFNLKESPSLMKGFNLIFENVTKTNIRKG